MVNDSVISFYPAYNIEMEVYLYNEVDDPLSNILLNVLSIQNHTHTHTCIYMCMYICIYCFQRNAVADLESIKQEGT